MRAFVIPLYCDRTAEKYITPSRLIALAALGVHTLAMLATITAVSAAVYEWVGFLRSGWVNFDLVWTVAPLVCGVGLFVA